MADAGPASIQGLAAAQGSSSTQSDSAPTAQGPQGTQQSNPMAALMGGQGPGKPPPSPDLEQTMTMMKHFGEMRKYLVKLLSDPDVGRKNMRPSLFQAAANLLGDGFATMPQIINTVQTFPTDPAEQKKWLQVHLKQIMMAQAQIIDDFRQSHPGSGDWKADAAQMPSVKKSGRSHTDIVQSVQSHYQGARRVAKQ